MWLTKPKIKDLALENSEIAELELYKARLQLQAAESNVLYWQQRLALHRKVLEEHAKPSKPADVSSLPAIRRPPPAP